MTAVPALASIEKRHPTHVSGCTLGAGRLVTERLAAGRLAAGRLAAGRLAAGRLAAGRHPLVADGVGEGDHMQA